MFSTANRRADSNSSSALSIAAACAIRLSAGGDASTCHIAVRVWSAVRVLPTAAPTSRTSAKSFPYRGCVSGNGPFARNWLALVSVKGAQEAAPVLTGCRYGCEFGRGGVGWYVPGAEPYTYT